MFCPCPARNLGQVMGLRTHLPAVGCTASASGRAKLCLPQAVYPNNLTLHPLLPRRATVEELTGLLSWFYFSPGYWFPLCHGVLSFGSFSASDSESCHPARLQSPGGLTGRGFQTAGAAQKQFHRFHAPVANSSPPSHLNPRDPVFIQKQHSSSQLMILTWTEGEHEYYEHNIDKNCWLSKIQHYMMQLISDSIFLLTYANMI